MTASVPSPPDSYPADPVPATAGQGTLDAAERIAFWLALTAAVLGIVVGVMIMVWPEATQTFSVLVRRGNESLLADHPRRRSDAGRSAFGGRRPA